MAHVSEFSCIICHKGLQQGIAVHRVNANGRPGIWACTRHLSQTDAPKPDAGAMAVVRALQGGRK